MDKYELSIKIEQAKKMINKGDYEAAIEIADTIDWRRVRNVNILFMVATIYEKNQGYQEVKDILPLVFERAPIGRRPLFKLAELVIEEGSTDEVEDYYRGFCGLAPDDPRQYILRYMILGVKGAPVEQLIHTLKQYCNTGLDEKWLYELAELYVKADMGELCTMARDKIMLMFNLNKYVEKAVELKIQLAPLTKYQMDLVGNRDKCEVKLRAVEEKYRMSAPVEEHGDTPAAGSRRDHYGAQSASCARGAVVTREPGCEEERDCAQELGYAGESNYDQGSDYGRGTDYGQGSDYAQEPGYVRESNYLQEPGYAQESECPRVTENSRQGNHDSGHEGKSGSGGGYGEGSVYTEEPGYAEEPEYVEKQEYVEEQEYIEELEYAEESACAPESGYGHGRYSREYFEYSRGRYSQYADDRLMGEDPPHIQVTIEPEDREEKMAVTGEMSEKLYGDGTTGKSFEERSQELGVEQKKSAGDQQMSDEVPKARVHEAGVQANLATEISRTSGNGFKQEVEAAQIRVLSDIRDIRRGAVCEAKHFMIEAETLQQGLEKATEALKEIHREAGAKNQAARIAGEWLNSEGVFNLSDKLTRKDLMIEQAGDMTRAILQELSQLMARDEIGTNVVLIDAAERSAALHRVYPGLTKRFEYIGESQPPRENGYEASKKGRRPVGQVQVHRQEIPKEKKGEPVRAMPQEPLKRLTQGETQPVTQTIEEQVPTREEKKQPVMKAMEPTKEPARREVPVTSVPVKKLVEPEFTDNEELPMDGMEEEKMDIGEFARYVYEYASDISCNISGRGMPVLHEKIEIMEEDGITLTKENTEDLIKETIDKAEGPSFFKRTTGVFPSKYDRDGLLILKEGHSI